MLKVFLVVTLTAITTLSTAMAREAGATTKGLKSSSSVNVSRRHDTCNAIFYKCSIACDANNDERDWFNCMEVCWQAAQVCEKIAAWWTDGSHIASGGGGEGNIKVFPEGGGSKLKAHANPNAGVMSKLPGGTTATTPAVSGPVPTLLNPPSSSSISKPAAGKGNGLLSGPGMPRLKTQ
jgi:hypothetical protein